MTHIKPRLGLIIRDPNTLEILPEQGKDVNLDTYWRRRIANGDIEIQEQKPKKEHKKSETIV
jgi:hypothetical protein